MIPITTLFIAKSLIAVLAIALVLFLVWASRRGVPVICLIVLIIEVALAIALTPINQRQKHRLETGVAPGAFTAPGAVYEKL